MKEKKNNNVHRFVRLFSSASISWYKGTWPVYIFHVVFHLVFKNKTLYRAFHMWPIVVSLCRVEWVCCVCAMCVRAFVPHEAFGVPRYSIRYVLHTKLHNNIRFVFLSLFLCVCGAFSGLGSTGCTSCLSLDVCFLFSFVTFVFSFLCMRILFLRCNRSRPMTRSIWKTCA